MALMTDDESDDRPVLSYAALLAVHTGLVGGAMVLAARQGRLPRRVAMADLAVGAIATFKLSRLITRSAVASPLRAPFTGEAEPAGPAEVMEEVEGSGIRRAVGELLTCPFCLGHWIATGFCLGLVYAPELTRTVGSVLCIEAGADLLQHAHARLPD